MNEEKNLKDFLNSVCDQNQNFWSFELVVVDGGSTDRSRIIIDKFRRYFPITGIINEKRNLGFIRNYGSQIARGEILLFTNSDSILAPDLLRNIDQRFRENKKLFALSGRTIPLNTGDLTRYSYISFDKLRKFYSMFGRFSPSGNFLAIRKQLFVAIGGFPEVPINEDGELGSKISRFARLNKLDVAFDENLTIFHRVKKKRSGFKTLLFYFYVLGNFNDDLLRLFRVFRRKRSLEFQNK